MRIVQLTPGAGGMFCGSCLRDNALVHALRKLGHDTLMVPLYLPLTVDEEDGSAGTPVFFGGINVYLQQKSKLFRNAPKVVGRLLAAPSLLKWASGFAGQTRPEDVAELTISMLKGEEGYQAEEVHKLVEWLKNGHRPDVICLSNALLVGLARRLKAELNAPVLCTLHGEDAFLDSMPEPHRTQAWDTLRERAADIDAFVPVSRYYGEHMRARLGLPAERFHAVYNGINLDGFAPAESPCAAPVLGYFARISPEKGMGLLVDAFLQLRARAGLENLRLHIGGSLSAVDEPFAQQQKDKVAQAGAAAFVTWRPNATREEKISLLQGMRVCSVPATYGEAFGLYVLESLACGVPVVVPQHAAFPELLAETGGGVLCAPDDAGALATALEGLLRDPEKARKLGAEGRTQVMARFTVERMAREVAQVYARVASGKGSPHAV